MSTVSDRINNNAKFHSFNRVNSNCGLLELLNAADNATAEPLVGGVMKRLFDILVAAAAIILLAPLMLLVAAVIQTTMGGPVLFSHRRVGAGGRLYGCLKFRTMIVDGEAVLARHLASDLAAADEWRATQKLIDDPRVTRFGCFLRRSSIDELPQLFNILVGQMSCVGPRPVTPVELERFGSHQADVLRARPGLTGLWQVSGRSRTTYDDRVRLDTQYIALWSFVGDIKIMIRTVPVVLTAAGAA